jgi:glycosyltransferase involved in cell wall biosynthesis
VAVIYPPVRDLIIQASLCRDAYLAGGSIDVSFHRDRAGGQNPTAAAPGAAAAPADRSAASSTTDPAAAEMLLLDPQHFNILFVGRLARVKSPGLLIKALGYLLATAEREWEEALDAVGSTEETVEQRYRRELAAIIMREQGAVNGKIYAISRTASSFALA